ncbi:zinc-dependent metalloprotease [Chondrinema litorale]|uniref:zinc-dependent metalloprotease n=1 Tax=Chondrinema litorale TaxID=2994555 RepID=UPI0025433B40|nr:zinc-dependent metalloprotease [Chondrinema litorale]UZS00078.1 zinc-dependent metalloprotease [Chondrinema litorale]
MKKTSLFLLLIIQLLLQSISYSQSSNPSYAIQKIQDFEKDKLSINKLNTYLKLQKSSRFKNVSLIEVSNITELIKNDEVIIDLFGETRINTKRLIYQNEEDFIWEGEFSNKGKISLFKENGRIYGQIRKKNKVFDIQYLEDGVATLIEYDMNKLNQLQCATEEKLTSQSLKNNSNKANTRTADDNIRPTVDVLCLYTPAALATGLSVTDVVNTAKNQWLSSQINSNVHPLIRIAGYEELNFIENYGGNDIGQDATELSNNVTAQQLRDQYQADLVILLTDGNYPGVGGVVDEIGPNEDHAYGVVQILTATSTYTWIHELAHLFGARHQNDPAVGEAHGYGWSTGTLAWINRYGTIMHTYESSRERLLYFSNPDITYEGEVTGIDNTNFNTKVINTNGWDLADFRYIPSNMTTMIYGPGLADSGDNLSFSCNIYNGQSPFSYTWAVGRTTVGTSNTLSYTMPTDQDLNLRLSVTGGDGQTASATYFVRNSYEDGGNCTVCPDSLGYDIFYDDIDVDNIERDLLYPNPSSNLVRLKLTDQQSSFNVLQIIDLSGSIKFETQLSEGNYDDQFIELNLDELKPSIYFIKLIGQTNSHSFKFIKK